MLDAVGSCREMIHSEKRAGRCVYWRACAAASDRVCIMSGQQQQQHRIRLYIFILFDALHYIDMMKCGRWCTIHILCSAFPVSRRFLLFPADCWNSPICVWKISPFGCVISLNNQNVQNVTTGSLNDESIIPFDLFLLISKLSFDVDWKIRHSSLFHIVDPEIVKRSMDLELMTQLWMVCSAGGALALWANHKTNTI